jgi:hypothetical protein
MVPAAEAEREARAANSDDRTSSGVARGAAHPAAVSSVETRHSEARTVFKFPPKAPAVGDRPMVCGLLGLMDAGAPEQAGDLARLSRLPSRSKLYIYTGVNGLGLSESLRCA